MKYLISLSLVILSFALVIGNDRFNLIRPNLNLLGTITTIEETNDVFSFKNKREDAPIPKNGYDLDTGVVWREKLINDGQQWYIDRSKNVYWRYLRQNENPNFVPFENPRKQVQAMNFAPAMECRG